MEDKCVSIVKVKGRPLCRGDASCKFNDYENPIPKGTKALRISIYGAGGGATAWYCPKCMIPILDQLQECLATAETE
jgi:hypothetical protein